MQAVQSDLPSAVDSGAGPAPDRGGAAAWWTPYWILLALALVLPALIVIAVAWQERRVLLREGEQTSRRTVVALSEHALKVLETHSLVLEQVDAQIRDRRWRDIAADARLHRHLVEIAAKFEQVQSIGLIDAQGQLRQSSLRNAGSGISTAHRDFFVAHRDVTAGRLFISEAFEGGISKTKQFTVSMRRTTAEGGFDGLIVVAVALDYFTSYWQQFAPSIAHVIPLMRSDGTMLVRYPAANPQKLPPTAPFMVQIAAAPDGGFYVAQSKVDGIERMNAFRRIGSHPLYVSFSVEVGALLEPWRERLALYAAFGLLTTLALAAMVLMAMRNARRQYEVTARWQDTAARYQAEIERRQRTEAELMQAQKMEAVGQLTGGVAHDFNNLLHAMGLNLRLAERVVGNSPAAQFHDNIGRGIERATQLTQRLTAFSRRQRLEPRAFDPGELLQRMADLLASTIGDPVVLDVDSMHDVWPVFADPNQTELALLNLAVNARDAMPEGGHLTIRARKVSFAAPHGGLAAGDYVELAVIDTGTGMAPEVLERAFEPFFTTKDVGKGSGLGLSMAHGFAKQSGGGVEIDSRIGHGTTVRLLLPRATAAAEPLDVPRAAGRESSPLGGHLLLAEDDPLVRRSMLLALTGAGYRVEEAASGAEAMEVLRRGPVDLLVTDYAMPGMSGCALAQLARALHPGLPVILVTGYAAPALDAAQPEQRIASVLHKPFAPHELVGRVEALLRAPREREARPQA
jgi:signal transduction histidine kinase